MVRISEEYQEVEYVESSSDGDPFILTDILMPKEIVCYHTFTLLQYKDQYGWGAIGNGFSGAGFGQYSYKLQYNYSGSHKYAGNPAISIGKKYSTKLILLDGRQELYVDGVQGQSWNKTNTKDGENIRIVLFRANGSSLRGAMRMYYIKFTNADESIVLGEFIPCYRKSDDEIGMYDTVSKTFYTNSGTGTFLKGHNVYYDSINLLEQRRKILLNTPHLETVSNNIATFNTDMNVSLKDCKIYFSPIQEGEGDPSPDNVRPISGWDGVTITRCGKNLLDAENPDQDGFVFCYLPKGTKLTYSIEEGTQIRYYRKDKTEIDYWTPIYTDEISNRKYRTFTLSEDAYYWKTLRSTSTKGLKLQLELRNSSDRPTSYEPYKGSLINISFPQTIYGGYVDLIKGEIVKTYQKYSFTGDQPLTKQDGYVLKPFVYGFNGNTLKNIAFTNSYNINLSVCNKLKLETARFHYVYDGCISITNSRVYVYLLFNGSNIFGETAEEAKAKLKEWYDNNEPLEIASKLKQGFETTYSINPQTLKTLKGTNNIFSNANGNIQVKFWKH